ncbi:MAG: ABC transporter permease [Betaproteobacteria bacterium SG8_39]|nr:MAG: ABC transporter permease [Betaproteobacteria bacterium SG8_39]
MLATLKLAGRMLARDWRAGELRVLAAALVVAVASVTSVAFFADRVSQALVRDAHQLLGADLVMVSDHSWDPAMRAAIAERGLREAEAWNFISMVRSSAAPQTKDEAPRSQLAGVKAVSAAYPLRGRLRTAPALGAPDAPAAEGPARGTVWIEERLVSALGAPVGTRLRLGRGEFTVAAVLTLEPERSANFFNIAPRLMMHLDDVAATGLVQPGSRVRYYLYAAGGRDALAGFEAWAAKRLARGQRIDTLENGRPNVRASLDRAQRFLGLTALLAAVLAGVAVALGTRRFVERHLDGVAVMRCLGTPQGRLLALFAAEFSILGLAACALGSALGFAAQGVIAGTLADLLRAELPPPTLLPALRGFLVGLVLLLGFALPPLVQLKNVPALRVMRREAGTPKASAAATYAIGLGLLAGLLVWQAGDVQLGLTIVGGFAGAVVLYALVAWAALALLSSGSVARRIGARSPALRYGLANLRRHARSNAIQVASLALGLTAVLLLSFTRNDLVDAWRRAAPPDAPNRFVLGIQRDQLAAVKAFFSERDITVPDLYPMVRGRLTAVNGAAVKSEAYEGERAKRLVERAFNLSYADTLPSHNRLAAGRWWTRDTGDAQELSVEEGIAKTLGWKLGDTLTFTVGSDAFTARVTSLRRLRWDSMKVNFFVMAPPRLLEDYAASFITAFRLPDGHEQAMNALAARFPNLTVVDVGAAVRQAQAVIDQLITAVQFVFLFALGAGVLVLYSALVATEDERRREAALMRVVGASRRHVTGSQRVEFLAMGVLAGALATTGAAVLGQLLARRVFELDLPPSVMLIVVGPLAGVLLLSLNAWLSSRKVLRASPALALREET